MDYNYQNLTTPMATIINNPSGGEPAGSSGMGMVVGVLIVIALVALFIIFGLPMIRGGAAPAPENPGVNVDVNLPTGGGSGGGGEGGGGTGGNEY